MVGNIYTAHNNNGADAKTHLLLLRVVKTCYQHYPLCCQLNIVGSMNPWHWTDSVFVWTCRPILFYNLRQCWCTLLGCSRHKWVNIRHVILPPIEWLSSHRWLIRIAVFDSQSLVLCFKFFVCSEKYAGSKTIECATSPNTKSTRSFS